jgi:PAS domain S-box-containing protein
MVARQPPAAWRIWLPGVLVALLGVGGSVWLALEQAQAAHQVEQARFAQAAQALTEALTRRLDTYTEIAFGLRGLFVVNPGLGRQDFDHAVGHLATQDRLPEILNIAFTRYVKAADKPAFEQSVRADRSIDARGYPDFVIRPPGNRAEYFVAHYLWPMEGNQQVHGLDISAQPTNLLSMRHSMQSGEPVASAPFDLLQFATHPTGFVIRVPVFAASQNLPRPDARGARFLGSVSVTLRVQDLFQRLEREGRLQGLQVSLTDRGSSIASQSDASPRRLYSNLRAGAPQQTPLSRRIEVYSRLWELDFVPDTAFTSAAERQAPRVMGLAGSVIGLLLAALVTLLMRQRQAALARAADTSAALEDSEGRWKFAIEGSGDGLWDWNIADDTVFYSARWKALLGFGDDEVVDRHDEWTRRLHPDDLVQTTRALQAHLASESPLYVSEYRMACKDGSWKWLLDRGQVVRRDAGGAPQRMIGTLSDISGRKRTAEVLQASLRDKEALLKEVHHRVKNNLQVITSLLRLESRRTLQAETRATLSDMQGRIGSMAQLHQSLYQSGTYAAVDLAEYLFQVVRQAFGAVTAPGASVELRSDLASVQVGMDQALPCGLLVNELVSNALKHGFPEGRAGEVRTTLQPAPQEGTWLLRVSDTGVGLPADFELARQKSMGLQLVTQLCQQLGGTLEVHSRPGQGAAFSVSFRVDTPAPLVMPA